MNTLIHWLTIFVLTRAIAQATLITAPFIALAIFLSGCASTQTTWQSQLAPKTIANKTVVAVAEHYGGPKAANLASSGLYAAADVLQGYVDKKPPLDIIVQSPGVEGVGHILVNYLKDKGIVTQATVNAIHKAAAFATRLTYTADPK